ncbi:MAG: hypothetical protein IT262_13235 [Saprospiraceae bacterium]|nr:hypothetical protein [Saprospiraceae bacterium]MCC6281562.1 hypothetical protein [Saprospiraceae bacterium]
MNRILESPLFQHSKPWWLPIMNLGITLYGILFLQWDLKPIVFLFWWEVILIVASALLRMLFALENRPFLDQIGLKIGLLIGGAVMGGTFIMFAVVFTINAFQDGGDYTSLANIAIQTRIMTAGYILGLAIHYFGNGNYKTASPMGELARPFVHMLVLLAFLQALTMHLIPKYPQLNQAMWVAIALVVLKFMVDMLFARIGKSTLSPSAEQSVL